MIYWTTITTPSSALEFSWDHVRARVRGALQLRAPQWLVNDASSEPRISMRAMQKWFQINKGLVKNRHFFLIHHYKSGQRYTVPAMATNSSASGMHSLTLPPPTLPTWDTKYLVSEDSPTAFESQEIKLWEKSWKDISKRIWPGLSKKKDRELFLLGVNSSSSSGKWKNIMADL